MRELRPSAVASRLLPEPTPDGPNRPLRARLRVKARIVFVTGLALLCLGSSRGDVDASPDERMRGLDEQVQAIKSEVLEIAAELARLEEKLVYPSGTQVSVFVSLESGASLELDAIRLEVDGEPVAHHIYSFKELEALRKGGVQRVYTGNVPAGDHHLAVWVRGKLGGADFDSTQRFDFQKEVEPSVLGLTLADAGSTARIELGNR